MIISIVAIVTSALSIAVSAYSLAMTRRAARASRERLEMVINSMADRPYPVVKFDGVLTPAMRRKMARIAGDPPLGA